MQHEDVIQDSYVEYMGDRYYVLWVGHKADPIIITKPENKDMKALSYQPTYNSKTFPVYDRALIELVKAADISEWTNGYSHSYGYTHSSHFTLPQGYYLDGMWIGDDSEEEEPEPEYIPPDESKRCHCDMRQLMTPENMGGGHDRWCYWANNTYKKKDIIK